MPTGLWLSVRKHLHTAAGERVMDIELSADECRFVALFGPSGAGKSTLLRMIAGLTAPDDGVISMDDEIWFDSTNKINVPAQKRRVGLVFQDYALFPAMTVEKNIAYGIRGHSDKSRMDYLIDAFDLKQLCKRYPETLSGGQKQRVALARALVNQPRILLLDEPLSALDPAMRCALQDELARVHRDMPVITFLVSHDMGEIFKLASHMFHINEGKIIASGSPDEVFGGHTDRLKITGQILSKQEQGVICILTVVVGADVSRVAVLRDEAMALNVGDMVGISAKSFNPEVKKIIIS
jgi:molybdate transport system ATP-binding protein